MLINYDLNEDEYKLNERHLYGAERLGVNSEEVVIYANNTFTPYTHKEEDVVHTEERGHKRYELTNHLGNVLAVINDRKMWNATDGNYDPVLLSWSDYYAFGMTMPGRNGGMDYRYQFNGMETDNEISGSGNSYTTEFRQYDPRLGRWKSLDPLMAKFPHSSPYVAYANNPIYYVDPYGLEPVNEGDDGDRPGGLPEQSENGKIYTGDNGVEYIGTDDGGYSILGKDVSYVHNDTGGATVEGSNSDNPMLPPSRDLGTIPRGISEGAESSDIPANARDLTMVLIGNLMEDISKQKGLSAEQKRIVLNELQAMNKSIKQAVESGNFRTGGKPGFGNKVTVSPEFDKKQKFIEKQISKLTGGSSAFRIIGTGAGALGIYNSVDNMIEEGPNAQNIFETGLGVVCVIPIPGVMQAANVISIVYYSGKLIYSISEESPHVDHMKGKTLEQQSRGYICFSPDTKVWKSNGMFVPISDIKPGDSLYTYNVEENKLEIGVVRKKVSALVENICHARFGNDTVRVTKEHPFYSNHSWKKIMEIQKGEFVKTYDGSITLDSDVSEIYYNEIVVNIEVEGQNNYFITEQKILVHNKFITKIE